MENFFEYNQEKFHEYVFLYLAKLKENSNLKYKKFFDGIEEEKHLKFAWFDKKELDEYNVVPIQIKDILKEIIDISEQNMIKSKMRR